LFESAGIRATASGDGVQRIEYWVDLSRDYVPIDVLEESRMGGDKIFSKLTYSDYRQTPNGWMPMRWVRTDYEVDADGEMHPFDVRVYTLNISYDPRVVNEVFKLELGGPPEAMSRPQ
jgi:hypothetical protein